MVFVRPWGFLLELAVVALGKWFELVKAQRWARDVYEVCV